MFRWLVCLLTVATILCLMASHPCFAIGCGKNFTAYRVMVSAERAELDDGMRCLRKFGSGAVLWYGQGIWLKVPYRFVGVANLGPDLGNTYHGFSAGMRLEGIGEEKGNSDQLVLTIQDRFPFKVTLKGSYGFGQPETWQEEWLPVVGSGSNYVLIPSRVIIPPSQSCGSRFRQYSAITAGEGRFAIVVGMRCELDRITPLGEIAWYGDGMWPNGPRYAHLGIRTAKRDGSKQWIGEGADLRLEQNYCEGAAPQLTFKPKTQGADYIVPEWNEAWQVVFDSVRYNQIRQLSSHNSYDERSVNPLASTYKLDIEGQLRSGIRSFEFDLHRAIRVSLAHPGHMTVTYIPGEWSVSHTGGRGEYCGELKECLGKIQAWRRNNANHEVITVFLQTDHWSTGHKPVDFDRVLDNVLGKDMYTPLHMIQKCPNSTSLRNALARCGWPKLERLRNKLIIAIMGDNEDNRGYLCDTNYYSLTLEGNNGYQGNKNCFTAFDVERPEHIDHHQHAIMFNINTDWVNTATEVNRRGYVSRLWRIDDENDGRQHRQAIDNFVHHFATDHVTMDLFQPVFGTPALRFDVFLK
ncbi:MAG: hypothetical protein HY537_11755 [Deltaproteobacteria bacterium]|nr:hypothetical protein [Deltaproteobacteria bacterium]